MRPLALLVVLALGAGACSEGDDRGAPPPSDGPTSSCAPPSGGTDLAYVDGGDPQQVLDLYLPPDIGCDPVPLVVWVHGGGWRIGDKSNAIEDKVAHWNDAGWALASVNYRLTDASLPEADRVMAPDHNEDVAAAVGWLVDRAAELGIDPDHLALLGHSAGAGIVAALATDPAYLEAVGLEPTDVGCVAPLDTEAFDIASAVSTLAGTSIYQDAFGTDPDRWAELSPQTHVGEGPIPDLFLVTRGTAGRRAVVQTFVDAVDAVDAAGGEATVIDLPTFTHADVNQRIGDPTDTQLTPALDGWLTTCLTS